MSDTLYEQDFFRWTQEQAAALRGVSASSVNLPLDWENLAEEIESLGRSDRRELASRIATIIEHLLTLEYSSAVRPQRGWQQTIRRERLAIERLLEDSPSLRQHVAELVAEEDRCAAKLAAYELEEAGDALAPITRELSGRRYTDQQILGDWFPDKR
jgi:hypothetical protein